MLTNYGYANNLGLDPNLGINTPTPFSQIMSASGMMRPSVFDSLPPLQTMSPPVGMGSSNPMVDILKMLISLKSIDASIGDESDSAGDFSRNYLQSMQEGGMNFDFDFGTGNTPLKRSYGSAKEIKIKDLSPEFMAKVDKIAKKINCDPIDLLAVMRSESGLNSRSRNIKKQKNGKPSNATGLIQFMPKTAKDFHTDIDTIRDMTPEKQLDLVEEYLVVQKTQKAKMPLDRPLSGADLYALVFLPAFAKREVLCRAGTDYYSSNSVLDRSKKGFITKRDLQAFVDDHRRAILKQKRQVAES